MLRTLGGMVIFGKVVQYIIWHCNINIFLIVIPCQIDAAVDTACPVCFDGAVAAECIEEMISMLLSNVFDSKIIYH